jgi:anti-anti-sigma factor
MTKEPPMVGRGGAAAQYPTEITGDGVAIVAPTGRLDLAVAPVFGQHLIDLVGTGHTRVVVDLSAVELIDSSGLGALVAGFEAARDNGGDLKIMSPAEQPRLVLELTNVNRLLHTVTSVETAFDDQT